MSGHSKWSTIKHKKAAADAKKGKVFSKLAREIMVAAKSGSDLTSNITLRALVQKARGVNMPADNIDRAIKKGTGELESEALEERLYEGFAPGGVQVVIQALTDNHNRTTAEIRTILTRNGASLAQGVLRNFRRRGQIAVGADRVTEDRLLELALEAGAEDMAREGDHFVVTTEPSVAAAVAEALQASGVETEGAETPMIPEACTVITEPETAAAVLRIVEALEDLDDVQNVYTNMDVDDAVLAALRSRE